MEPAAEEEVIRLQASLLDTRLQGIPSGLRDLELDRPQGLVLHDDSARRHVLSMTNVADLQRNEVASAQLAVEALAAA